MKRIATITNGKGQVTGLVHGPDETHQQIAVNGRVWKFDFDEYFGPLWMKADGCTPRKCQLPTKNGVWEAFEVWMKARRKRLGLPEPKRYLSIK